jgi:hypothetical protein
MEVRWVCRYRLHLVPQGASLTGVHRTNAARKAVVHTDQVSLLNRRQLFVKVACLAVGKVAAPEQL